MAKMATLLKSGIRYDKASIAPLYHRILQVEVQSGFTSVNSFNLHASLDMSGTD